MKELSDEDLLREYEATGSNPAFTELVVRYGNMVHSIAARMVDFDTAKDVSQQVFLTLSRKAGKLKTPVYEWLGRTTFHLASKIARGSQRREFRENQASSMNHQLASEEECDWEAIQPHLDHAMDHLSDDDYRIIVLRYYLRQSARAAAEKLGISEETAQRRASRALQRLRDFFGRRGVTTSTSGLAVLLSANAVQSAPAGLAAAITASVALSAGTAAVSTAPFASLLTMTAAQKGLVAVSVAAAVGTGIFAMHQGSLRDQAVAAVPPLLEQMDQLLRERDEAQNKLNESQRRVAAEENLRRQFQARAEEGLRWRDQLARRDADLAALKRLVAANTAESGAWTLRAAKLQERAEATPEMKIPEVQWATLKDWMDVTKDPVETEEDYLKAFSAVRALVEGRFASHIHEALQKSMAASAGQFPTQMDQLAPYFDPPLDPAMLVRWHVVPVAVPNEDPEMVDNGLMIRLTPVDAIRDVQWAVDANGPRSARASLKRSAKGE